MRFNGIYFRIEIPVVGGPVAEVPFFIKPAGVAQRKNGSIQFWVELAIPDSSHSGIETHGMKIAKLGRIVLLFDPNVSA